MAGIYRTSSFLPLAPSRDGREPSSHAHPGAPLRRLRRVGRRRPVRDPLADGGFDELDAVGPYEILHGSGIPTEYATLDGAERVTASHGTVIVPPATLAEAPDLLVVPGGGWRTRSPVGTWGEYERGVIPAAIAERHAAGSTVASVCTGAMLLAKAGLLDGRPAVTHAVALDDLR